MAEGKFVVKYATFSDKSIVYQPDETEGHVDPTSKFYFEAYNESCDQITFESDDSGKLIPFREHSVINSSDLTGSLTGSSSWVSFVDGKLKNRVQKFSTQSFVGEFEENLIFGENFSSQMEGIIASTVENFKNLRVIGTADHLFEDYNFALSNNSIQFTVESNVQTLQLVQPTNINTVDSLFNDEKLRNVINFSYLPPIKKTNTAVDKKNYQSLKNQNLLLGDYPPWGPIEKLTFSDIKKELSSYEQSSKTVTFDPTSKDNDLVAQFFEITGNEAKKLDVIDYGLVNDNTSNPKSVTNHVYFVGKVMNDDNGTDCFLHLFTLVFSANEGEE